MISRITLMLTSFLLTTLLWTPASACTRLIYNAGDNQVLTARSMDWLEDLHSDFWLFPRGLQRDGGVGTNSIKWTAKYGSVVLSAYNIATTDGMNEKGLVANVLYLAESNFGELHGKPGLSIGAWAQYTLDNFATVAEAVKALGKEPFRLVVNPLPNGSNTTVHLSLSDATGDSAIFEYLDGKLTIHHGKQYAVMTNSPSYEKQLALDDYWNQIGGLTMLPGTNRASDRFVRASFYTQALPKFKDNRTAVAAAFSVIRNVSVPLGIQTPDKPNISTTIWRTVFDQKNRIYYYESAISPNIFWVNLQNIDFGKTRTVQKISLQNHPILSGDVSGKFIEAKPFRWMAPADK